MKERKLYRTVYRCRIYVNDKVVSLDSHMVESHLKYNTDYANDTHWHSFMTIDDFNDIKRVYGKLHWLPQLLAYRCVEDENVKFDYYIFPDNHFSIIDERRFIKMEIEQRNEIVNDEKYDLSILMNELSKKEFALYLLDKANS